ncbi:MAG: efflux RND transporter periplasmic adaptor subunit [Wenzhouxiangella sp.]|jgi:multidrug efflux system membrane fusion protein|nr:efflux RND transporter periplasmic adaptor subunit [Wenzhouxiangella sp.]
MSIPISTRSFQESPTDRPTRLHHFFFLGSVVLAALLLAGCDGPSSASPSPEQPGRPVRVVEARAFEGTETLRLPAALRASQRAHLAFLQPGYLAERMVQRGQTVAAGEVLAILHNPALQPGVAAAEASVNEARSRLMQLERDTARLEELVMRNLTSQDALDQTRASRDVARAALEQAEARRDEARNQLLDANLRAPFAGQIVEVMLEPGDFAASGQPVMLINSNERLEVELQLPGRVANRLQIGQTIDIMRFDDGALVDAQIVEIGGAQPGLTAPVIARLNEADSSDWRPGDAVYAELKLPSVDALSVPLTSIVNPGTRSSKIFRVRDQVAEEVIVETGRTLRGWVQTSGDLQVGDQIIVAGQAQLLDGEPVRIID